MCNQLTTSHLPMYPGHDPDTYLCIYDTRIPSQVPFSPKMLTTPFIGPLIIARRLTTQPKPRRRPPSSLNYERFMSLPADLMMRVCRFLYPRDLLALARTSKKLRAKFMKETSEPFWNATRYLTGMPDWRTVGFPQAAAMVYDSECQGWSCSEESSVMAFHVCRRYCLKCAQEKYVCLI
ncbi:hypothetical protein M407DRAFT_25620 [Tulasnella calospora MUT 4182]|uniref:F-box domain-containing protein n=1 Tax=Tulasnella calospora MUT 4182 TaxID=1051891 RepID=A0A0C3KUC1_9AGAM|nr:hypothetical protein M407DRAFT_25620 [Tulasnella calospora MUT 4182]